MRERGKVRGWSTSAMNTPTAKGTATIDVENGVGDLVRSKFRMFCDRNKTMMMQKFRTVRRSVDATSQLEKQ
jgi:hypothetical protein